MAVVTIVNKRFDTNTKQLIVTAKIDSRGGNSESEPFGRDDDAGFKWKLFYDGCIYLEALTEDVFKHSFIVSVNNSDSSPKAVSQNVRNETISGKRNMIARLYDYGLNFDVKITYPESAMTPDLPGILPVRGEYCDVKFKVGTEVIGFYKIMLAQRSDVFRTMFSSPVTDPLKANDPIEIKDASAIGFNAFLDIIYSGELPSDSDVCLEVLEIAEKYNCDYVKQIVGPNLVKKIKRENAIRILITADQCDLKFLKEVALKFLGQNPAHKLPDFEAMSPHLMAEVMEVAYASVPKRHVEDIY